EDEPWKLFTIRFARAAEHFAGLKRDVAVGLRGALCEMTENAVIHAQTDIPILIGYRAWAGVAQFCVADSGIGVLRSLKSCPGFQVTISCRTTGSPPPEPLL